MKAFLILGGIGVLAVVAVVLVKNTHFYAYSEVTDAQGRTSVHCYAGCDVVDSITGGASTPEIDDAVAIARTADDAAYRDATHGMDKLLRRGLSAAGRYLSFRCRLPDQPGALATLLTELAGLGANVLDVVHARFSPHLRIGEVEVLLQVETRGPGHADTVLGQLRAAGYTLIFS